MSDFFFCFSSLFFRERRSQVVILGKRLMFFKLRAKRHDVNCEVLATPGVGRSHKFVLSLI